MRVLPPTLLGALLLASPAHGQLGFALHAEGAAARMVGPGKADQFGWGGAAWLSPELTIGDHLGLELPLGAMVLSDGTVDDPTLRPTAGGYSLFALPGVRLRPFGRPHDDLFAAGGLWLGGGGGLAYTGGAARPALDARLGYDLSAASDFRGGPTLGFVQLIEPDDGVRPEDGRVLTIGIHGAFEVGRTTGDTVIADRDGDGFADDVDHCPERPEDRDGFADDDGCPDLDDDRDGIPDRDDRCRLQPEDADGFRDADGCPDPDNDRDGILDGMDRCPLDPEDADGFHDTDGCPDPDNDRDGIADRDDRCPDEAETVNDYADDDGCPDRVAVRVVGNEILLDERVHFSVNAAVVEPRSWPLLQRVAALLMSETSYHRIRIQGHADRTGEESYNQGLSVRRARAVMSILVDAGVDPARLSVEGFGELRPRDERSNPRSLRANRRVEFLILQRRTMQDVSP